MGRICHERSVRTTTTRFIAQSRWSEFTRRLPRTVRIPKGKIDQWRTSEIHVAVIPGGCSTKPSEKSNLHLAAMDVL